MANALFLAYRENMLGEGTRVDLDADTIKMMFVDATDDVPVAATDDFIDDIASAARVPAIASCPTLASKTIGTVAAGVFDAADPTFTSLTGDQVEYLIAFKDTGTESTSNLLALWDTATGLPLTPNGANVLITAHASGLWSV